MSGILHVGVFVKYFFHGGAEMSEGLSFFDFLVGLFFLFCCLLGVSSLVKLFRAVKNDPESWQGRESEIVFQGLARLVFVVVTGLMLMAQVLNCVDKSVAFERQFNHPPVVKVLPSPSPTPTAGTDPRARIVRDLLLRRLLK